VAVHEIRRETLLRIELAAPFQPDGLRALCHSLEIEGSTLLIEPRARFRRSSRRWSDPARASNR